MQPEGHPGFHFRPGQFGWLTVWGGPFKITGHPFSFSSSAAVTDGHVEMSIRNLGDFTNEIDEVPVGRRVYIDGPYGAFTIGNPADMHVLIAGGVGITPMMSMIRTLADQGDKRPVILFYGSKDWESITFREELEELKARLDLTVVHVLVNPPDGWKGERGFITAEVFKRHLPPPYAEHEYFICGPGAMMDAIENAIGELKVPHVEVPLGTLQLRLGEAVDAPFVCRPIGLCYRGDRDPDVGLVRFLARPPLVTRRLRQLRRRQPLRFLECLIGRDLDVGRDAAPFPVGLCVIGFTGRADGTTMRK